MSGKPAQGAIDASDIQQLMGDESAVSALSEKIAEFINSPQPLDLPPEVLRRVNALKNIQMDFLKLESEFYREVQVLEAKYMTQYQPLLDKRKDIVTGSYEPTEEESQWSDENDTEDKEKSPSSSESPATGIPDFWLTAMKRTDLFDEWIKEHDEPVLKKLTDIKVVYADKSGMNFSLEFHFASNEWFSNSVLTKSYKMQCKVDEDDPFSFEGPAISSCEGCKIDWKKGKNLTIKTIKKKQKHKGGGQARVVTKTVPNESFFTFFSPPKLEGGEGDEEEEEASQQLSDDYACAEFIRDRLVPKAVLFFTGEMVDDEDDFEGEDGEELEDEEEDDEEGGGGDYSAKDQVEKAKPPECQQQ